MELNAPFIPKGQSLADYYKNISAETRDNISLSADLFKSLSHQMLMQPAEWFKAFSILEMAVDNEFEKELTNSFFQYIFRSYDCYASADLNDEDYLFFWELIHKVFDKMAPTSSEALLEKGLQYFNPRRGYGDLLKTIQLLEQAAQSGNETARILYGYYLYMGLCDITDKERGLEMIESVQDPIQKQRAIIYKGYILLRENKFEEAKTLLDNLFTEGIDSSLTRLADEQKGFFLEIDGQYEEAATYYRKVLEDNCSSFSMLHLGICHYNRTIEGADPREGLKLMEKSFDCGRPEVARSLFYCYFESGQEWQDNDRAIYWINKGYTYNDAYSTYQLAYLYLYYDNYKDVEKGLFYLDAAIEMNYADALACKGYMYYAGDMVEKDLDKSVQLFTKAIELGSGYAAYRLGIIYEEGYRKGEADYQLALENYEKAAELGNIYGYEMSGRYHLVGFAGEANLQKAFDYYSKGVEMGSSYCMVELAFMYEEGNGVEQDTVKTYELVKQAAENDYAYAFYLLGRCYKYALGTEENPDEAIRYLQMGAEQNLAKAQTELALCYEEGYGVEANGKKALEYMLLAAEQEYTFAMYKVGCYYLYGMEGITTDTEESFKWMLKAAQDDYPYALLEVGDYYLWDYGDKDEKPKAYEYYVKAAEQDVVNEGLGLCLEYGIGVEENEPEAFKYYLKGAEDGYSRAMYNAGRCYYYGFGIKENPSEAFRWFNDAAARELTPAMYYKGKMLMNGEGCTQNMEEGIAMLTQAAEDDYAEAQFELANCYLVGKGVEVNEDLAMELFEQAADNGHEDAMKVTGRRKRK